MNNEKANASKAVKEDVGKRYAIGIDLGTTYSCVAVSRNKTPEVIPDQDNEYIIPSCVSISLDSDDLRSATKIVGTAAKKNHHNNPEGTIYAVKRLIGKRLSDFPGGVSEIRQNVLYDISEDPFGISLPLRKKREVYKPEDISAMVLDHLRRMASRFLDYDVKDAVITVPAYFTDAQRNATIDAGAMAGLNVLRTINEPTAAAIAYGIKSVDGEQKKVLVFDLGGGTFDVSLLLMEDGVFEVIAIEGDPNLGGEDFDLRLVKYVLDQISKMKGKEYAREYSKSRSLMTRMKKSCEEAKLVLSTEQDAIITIHPLKDDKSQEDLKIPIMRSDFVKINQDLFDKTKDIVTKLLEKHENVVNEIDDVVLVGGSTRIPKIREMLSDMFGKDKIRSEIDPDQAVAKGAAIQASILSGTDFKDSQIVVLDVNPLTLGIETTGGIMTQLIPRNTVIPTQKTQIFSTAADNQTTVTIRVYEGERPLTKDNNLLDQFDLDGILPAPRGVPKIHVTFEIDVNGILTVSAKEESGKSKSLTIRKSRGEVSKEQIERMLKDQELNATKDTAEKERIEAVISLEGYSESIYKQIKDKSSQLTKNATESEIEEIKKLCQETRDYVKNNPFASKEDCEKRKAMLEKVLFGISSRVYGTAGQSEHGPNGTGDKPERKKESGPFSHSDI